MGKHAIVLGLVFLGLAGLAVLAGWAAFGIAGTVGGASLSALWPYLLGAVAALAAVIGFLTWVTSYAARRRSDQGRAALSPRSAPRASPSRTAGRPRR